MTRDRAGTPMRGDRDFWREVLLSGAGTAVPRWVLHPVPGMASQQTVVPGPVGEELLRLTAELGAPLGSVALAAHGEVLAALSGERQVLTGYRAAAMPAALPCRLSTDPVTWRDLLVEAHCAEAEVVGHAEFPVHALARELGAPAPYYETVVDTGGVLTGAAVLGVGLAAGAGGLTLGLTYRTDAYDAEAAARIVGYHLTALALMAEHPDRPHQRDSLLSDRERRFQIHGLSGPHRKLPDRRVHELFEERARLHPDAVAAVQGTQRLTYRELNHRANRIGRALLTHGLRAEGVVAVVTERNLDWMAAVLGVLKAGGAYLPIEPHFPPHRIAAMLSRAQCRTVLVEPGSGGSLDRALESLSGVTRLEIPAQLEQQAAGDDLGVDVAAGQLAYLYFTSGSTGEPKGAMCEHEGFLNHVCAKIHDLEIRSGQVVAQTAPQCFDISLWQLVAALLVGGRTLLVGQEHILEVEKFLDTIIRGRAAVVQVVPSYLEVVLSHLERHPRELPDLRVVCATGEALKPELARRWFAAMPEVRLVNAYGLTETSDDTNHEILLGPPPEGQRVPLGRPIQNVRVLIVEDGLALVPLGAPGEIVFSGVCVGRGYVNDPERTRQAFLTDPHRPGERLYRSGDYGRWLPDGKLEFLGRRDQQVKVRGFRVELAEVENALARMAGVRDCAVVVAGSTSQEAHLAGFYSAARALDPDRVREELAAALPGYMVPSVLHRMEELPLTGNGKVDRLALAALAEELEAGAHHRVPPRGASEERIAAAWATALGVPVHQIGRFDSFFDLGGTSLSAVKLAILLDRAVSLKDLVRHPVLADLAGLVDGAPDRRPGPVGPPAPCGWKEPMMSILTPGPARRLDVQSGRPPVLHVERVEDPSRWASEQRDPLRTVVAEHGAVLVRGLGLSTPDQVGAVFASLGVRLMRDREAFAPRREYSETVLSSTPWPASQQMCMHHELSYRLEFPGLMLFACLVAPPRGGATALADAATVLEDLPRDLVARFEREGWQLTRSYNGEIGASVAEAFGTDDRDAIDAYCRSNAIDFAWQPDGGLRTVQRRSAVVHHPKSGRRCWFNQVAFLNEWTLDPEVREYLIDMYGADALPFNTRFGNGDPLDRELVELLNRVYEANTVREPWQAGDLLIVDNVRTAHSREPFEGAREVVVGMAEPVRLADCSPTVEVSVR